MSIEQNLHDKCSNIITIQQSEFKVRGGNLRSYTFYCREGEKKVGKFSMQNESMTSVLFTNQNRCFISFCQNPSASWMNKSSLSTSNSYIEA
jgi:hypothetical protein